MTQTFETAYARFTAMYANSHPIRGEVEFDAAVHAAGLHYDDVDDDWLLALDEGWVYLRAPTPFGDEQANREYRRRISA
jgi:hypothetical protein